MSFKASQLASVDQVSQLTVFGYIRRIEQILQSSNTPLFKNIPELIILSCVFFYCPSEHFKIAGDGVEISEYPMTINKVSGGRNNTSYGALVISSISNAIYKWEFAVNASYAVIGISSNHVHQPSIKFSDDFSSYNYGYSHSGKICLTKPYAGSYKYGNQFGKNDVVIMTLDLSYKQLSFDLNGKHQGLAFRSIKRKENINYRLAISIFDNNGSVSILNFTAYYKE